MSEPVILVDYEFQFSSGEPIFVHIQEGRDSVQGTKSSITVTARPSKDVEEIATIYTAKLNGFRRTRRVVRDESDS